MTDKYSCTNDVMEHKRKVRYFLDDWARLLTTRAENHDKSKLEHPEKAMFDLFTPRLKNTVFGSDEYKAALTDMGEALKHHYEKNRHHPEHFPRGVNDMTLLDVLEMVGDWMAAAWAKGGPVDLKYLAQRFGLSEQLVEIIANTLREEDLWNEIGGANVPYLTPEDKRNGYVNGFEQVSRSEDATGKS